MYDEITGATLTRMEILPKLKVWILKWFAQYLEFFNQQRKLQKFKFVTYFNFNWTIIEQNKFLMGKVSIPAFIDSPNNEIRAQSELVCSWVHIFKLQVSALFI